ncbi:hypothetical protein J2Z66_005814 [Paenibacillus eucommiae]|uniref:Uncharacterized protein n=1 Tax=Paenibacillus eucommiae TaxID=1355755 RepID=A0ABS4J302_9BACL|nr:hypothetical protein [Paenibacillus eucommiae]
MGSMSKGGKAIASAFKDLFQPPSYSIPRERIFNSGWSPKPFPPETLSTFEHAHQRTPQSIFLMYEDFQEGLTYACILSWEKD